jgi:hypothetical protein
MVMNALLSVVAVVRRSAPRDGKQQGDLLAVLEALTTFGMCATDHGQGRAQGRSHIRLARSQAREGIVDGCAVLELERERRRPGEPG